MTPVVPTLFDAAAAVEHAFALGAATTRPSKLLAARDDARGLRPGRAPWQTLCIVSNQFAGARTGVTEKRVRGAGKRGTSPELAPNPQQAQGAAKMGLFLRARIRVTLVLALLERSHFMRRQSGITDFWLSHVMTQNP